MKYSSIKKCASFKENTDSDINTINSPITYYYINYNNLYNAENQNFCYIHNLISDIFCFTCVKNICSKCAKDHKLHKIKNYIDIEPPSKEEINILKMKIKSYKDRCNQLLYEIKNWKNILEKKIEYLEKNIYSSNLNDFVINYESNENDIKNIIKFKEIYSLINSQKKINKDKRNKNLNIFDINYSEYYQQYESIIELLDYISIYKYDFTKIGIKIIEFLSKTKKNIIEDENIHLFERENLNNSIQSLKVNLLNFNEIKNINKISNKKHNYNTYNGYIRNNSYTNKDTKSFLSQNQNKTKEIYNKKIIFNYYDEMNNSFNSYKSFNSLNNITHNYFSSFFSNENKESISKILYTKKGVNTSRMITPKPKLNKSSKTIEQNNKFYCKKNQLNHSLSLKRENSINLLLNKKTSFIKNNPITINYQNKKTKEIKYFTHKKFIQNLENINNNYIDGYLYQDNQNNKFQLAPLKSSIFPAIQNNIKDDNTNDNVSNNLYKNFYKEEKNGCIRIIKTTPEKHFKINADKPLCIGLNLDNSNCKISLIDQNANDIQLICFKKDEYYIPTVIYLDENNEDIKIGHDAILMGNISPNQIIFNLIKLFGKNFDEIKEKKKLWPFNLYKEPNGRMFIKINYCGKKDKKFYIENLLILYLEELFKKLFSKIIIEEDEIKENYKNETISININICITIPIYFNYIKRKILEKIFQKHIFQNMIINYNYDNNYDIISNNSPISISKQNTACSINYINFSSNKNNKYNRFFEIKLNYIKIENSPYPSVLCLQNNNNDESISSSFSFQSCSKENNILILNILDDSTNISINSISNEKIENNSNDKSQYVKKYQVKNISNLNFGQEDFINNYIFYTLKKIDSNIYNDIMNSPNDFQKIKNIFLKNINMFDKKPKIELQMSEYCNYEFKIILDENDYINACIDLFNKIISLIKNILIQSKLSQLNIDDIVLIGQTCKCKYIKKMLSELFQDNKIIYNKLIDYNFENDDFYLVSGTALEAMNNTIKKDLKLYILKDICPNSFGIENSKGEVDLIIKKGDKIPVTRKNFVKIAKNKNNEFVDIKICEIDNENKKMILSCNNINCKKMKLINKNKSENKFIELLFEFEVDENLNLSVFILDRNTFKKRFEFSINIDVIKD